MGGAAMNGIHLRSAASTFMTIIERAEDTVFQNRVISDRANALFQLFLKKTEWKAKSPLVPEKSRQPVMDLSLKVRSLCKSFDTLLNSETPVRSGELRAQLVEACSNIPEEDAIKDSLRSVFAQTVDRTIEIWQPKATVALQWGARAFTFLWGPQFAMHMGGYLIPALGGIQVPYLSSAFHIAQYAAFGFYCIGRLTKWCTTPSDRDEQPLFPVDQRSHILQALEIPSPEMHFLFRDLQVKHLNSTDEELVDFYLNTIYRIIDVYRKASYGPLVESSSGSTNSLYIPTMKALRFQALINGQNPNRFTRQFFEYVSNESTNSEESFRARLKILELLNFDQDSIEEIEEAFQKALEAYCIHIQGLDDGTANDCLAPLLAKMKELPSDRQSAGLGKIQNEIFRKLGSLRQTNPLARSSGSRTR